MLNDGKKHEQQQTENRAKHSSNLQLIFLCACTPLVILSAVWYSIPSTVSLPWQSNKVPVDVDYASGDSTVFGNVELGHEYQPGTETRTWGNNYAQFLYVVGVEGSGHHGIVPVLKSLASYADLELVSRSRYIRQAINHQNAHKFTRLLQDATMEHGVYLEDRSFPTMDINRKGSPSSIAHTPEYDLKWIVETAQLAGADVKVIILHRDFIHTVWSHRKLDGGVVQHAKIMAKYLSHINLEVKELQSQGNLISQRSWTRIEYDWFAGENCHIAVEKLSEFLNWPCPRDLEGFCSRIPFEKSHKVVQLTSRQSKVIEAIRAKEKSHWAMFLEPGFDLLEHFS